MKSSSRIIQKLRRNLPLNMQMRLLTIKKIGEAFYYKPRGYKNFFLNAISYMIHSKKAFGRPVSITIEPTNICNLRCPVCETGAGILKRKPKIMSYEEFVKIIDKIGPGANHLMLYYMGEPFLNKDIYQMIRYAKDMGLYVMTCTNGDLVDPMELYNSGINLVSFQIGGVTQETHQIYRINSNLERILKNVNKYLELIRLKGRKPREHQVELGLIVMRHNEREIKAFLGIAKEMGIDRINIINPCVRNLEQAREFLPSSDAYWIYERERFEQKGILSPKQNYPKKTCAWLYYSITIQVDGNVVPCCHDPHGDLIMGNLFNQSLEDIWNGNRFMSFRHSIFKNPKEIEICKLCPGEGLAPLF